MVLGVSIPGRLNLFTIKLHDGINRYFQKHMETRLLDTKILIKCGVLWAKMAAALETFHINLVITTYGKQYHYQGD